MDTYLHEKQVNNLNYDNYSIRYIYIEIYHFIIEIIFKVNSILELFDKKKYKFLRHLKSSSIVDTNLHDIK